MGMTFFGISVASSYIISLFAGSMLLCFALITLILIKLKKIDVTTSCRTTNRDNQLEKIADNLKKIEERIGKMETSLSKANQKSASFKKKLKANKF